MSVIQFNKKYKKLKSQVTKEDIQGANTHLKRDSKSLVREMQSNNEILSPFQICWSWKMERTQFWHLYRKSGIFTHCWHAVIWYIRAIHWATVCLKAQLPRRQDPASHRLCSLLPVLVTPWPSSCALCSGHFCHCTVTPLGVPSPSEIPAPLYSARNGVQVGQMFTLAAHWPVEPRPALILLLPIGVNIKWKAVEIRSLRAAWGEAEFCNLLLPEGFNGSLLHYYHAC